MFKKIWNWVWDVDGARTTSVLSTSITGVPLFELSTKGFGSWRLSQTNAGLQGAHVSIIITQLGANQEMIKNLLRGEYDHCLSQRQKDSLLEVIRERVAEKGWYMATVRNAQGTLDFVRVPWEYTDLEEIKQLLAENE